MNLFSSSACRVLGANNMPLIVYQLMKNLDMKVTNVMVRTRQKKKKKKKTLDSTRLDSTHFCVCITYIKNVFIGCQDRLGTTKRTYKRNAF